MSIWACKKCGNLTGGSDGAPQCLSCGSLKVERVESFDNAPESEKGQPVTITITTPENEGWHYLDWQTGTWIKP